MPVRSLRSSVLRWPERGEVLAAVSEWAARQAAEHAGLLKLGVFGSFARGDSGPGSDLDLVAVVRESELPFERRALDWDLLGFFCGLFIVINVMEHAQVLHLIGLGLGAIIGLGDTVGSGLILVSSSVASSAEWCP